MEDEEFQGFVPPVSNFFKMPNEWINICAEITSLAELKVVQYVLRHTWGFQEYDGKPKPITTDEFMHGRKYKDGSRMDKGTGLSDRGVKDGVALAIKDKYLKCEVDDSDKARIKKFYMLNMLHKNADGKNLPTDKSDRKNSPISDGKNLPTGRKNSPSNKEESSYRSEKETLETNSKKNSEKDSQSTTNSEQTPSHTPTSTLLEKMNELERTFWNLWCSMPFNVIAPKLTETAYTHVQALAPHITTQEQMNSLVEYSRQKLIKAGKDGTVHLGNLRNDLNEWKQKQIAPNKRSDSWDDRMQALVPDFKVLKQWEIMELPMPERKAYNARLREHLAMQESLAK